MFSFCFDWKLRGGRGGAGEEVKGLTWTFLHCAAVDTQMETSALLEYIWAWS